MATFVLQGHDSQVLLTGGSCERSFQVDETKDRGYAKAERNSKEQTSLNVARHRNSGKSAHRKLVYKEDSLQQKLQYDLIMFYLELLPTITDDLAEMRYATQGTREKDKALTYSIALSKPCSTITRL